jgi:hypothetical protein
VGHRPMSHTEGGGAQAIVGSGWRRSHMSGFDRRLGPSAMVPRSGIREIGRQGVFAKIPNHRGGVFLRYVNYVGSEIDGSDLIYAPCAPMPHVH